FTVIDAITVLMTHLSEVLKAEAGALLTRLTVVKLLDEVRARQPGLVEELIPSLLSISDVQRILQGLLSEGVSIAATDLIVENLVDIARTEKDVVALTEILRQRLANSICNQLKGRRRNLAVMSLDPKLEHQVQTGVATAARRDALPLDP